MKNKKLTLGLLIFYLIALSWIILFKMQFSFDDLPQIRNINLIPFGESVIINNTVDVSEIMLNVVAFVPFGLLIHILWEKRKVWQQLVPIFVATLAFEIIQYVFAIGASDITDVINNLLGGVLGIAIAIGISKILKDNWIKIINIISLVGAILVSVFMAVIIFLNM